MTRLIPPRQGWRPARFAGLFLGLLAFASLTMTAAAQEGAIPPHWIWYPTQGEPQAETRYFRKAFAVKEPSTLAIDVTGDDRFTLYLDGQELTRGDSWQVVKSVTAQVPTGPHVLAIIAENAAPGPAGVLLRGGVLPLGQGVPIHTDASWKTVDRVPDGGAWLKPGFVEDGWVAAADLGILGTGPWQGLVFESGDASGRFTVPEGFTITTVAAPSVTGSAVSFTFDHEGNPCVGVERGPIVRLIDADADGIYESGTPITPQMKNCQGLHFDVANDGTVTLWAVGDGPAGTGIHRLADQDGDGVYETVVHYVPTDGMGEHGPHAITRGPDGALYFNAGNHAHIKQPIDPKSPVNQAFDYEGELLPHYPDARGHAAKIMAPGGEIYRSLDDGRSWSRLIAGFRNEYDFAFNRDGEIFSFDSDMEWDQGLPWYRPVRVNHCPIGAEFGWRNGSGKWPAYYYDSLPGVLDIGRGSPTGVTFLHSNWFPAEYDDNFLICDWSQGRILAVALERQGASYKATARNLVSGQPLNCTDIEVGPDGAVYFTNGGRGTLGGLFRVAPQTGKPSPPSDDLLGRAIEMQAPLSSFARRQLLTLREQVGREAWPRALVENYAKNPKQPSWRRVRGMDLLQQFEAGNEAVALEPLWIELARDEDTPVRAKAIQLLGLHDSDAARDVLTVALKDSDSFVRRRACEALVLIGGPIPVKELMPLLTDSDRWVRYAARVAIEHADDLTSHREALLANTDPRAQLEGMLALVRATRLSDAAQEDLFTRQVALLGKCDRGVSETETVDLLRLIGLTYMLGPQKVEAAASASFRALLLPMMATNNKAIAWETARLLAYLNEPKAIAKILAAQAAAGEADDRPTQIHYAYCLRAIKAPEGWTPEAKERLWGWYETASHWDGGFSYLGYLDFMVQELVNLLDDKERAGYLAAGNKFPFPTRVLVRGVDPATQPDRLLAMVDLYRRLDPSSNPAAVSDLRGMIVEKLGQSPLPEAHAALASLASIDPSRRDSIARALAERPTSEDLPVLVSALASNDPNTIGAVIMGLRRIDANPEGPEALRGLILLARRMGPNFAPQLNALARKWTGAAGPERGADLETSLKTWEALYAERYPDGPLLMDLARRKYTLDELVSEVLESPARRGASPERGRVILTQAQCLNCHKFGDEGQGLGPDLTTLSSRFQARDILKAMVEPSAEISDQYKPVMIATADGKVLNGMPAGDDPDHLILLLSDGTRTTIPKADIDEQVESSVSVMPEGLIDTLTPQQIADMIALFEAQPRVEVPAGGQ